VYWAKRGGRWRAQIQYASKVHNLGTFKNEEEAARAYDDVAREHHGKKARLNFPIEEKVEVETVEVEVRDKATCGMTLLHDAAAADEVWDDAIKLLRSLMAEDQEEVVVGLQPGTTPQRSATLVN
jgi:hypothetical protein